MLVAIGSGSVSHSSYGGVAICCVLPFFVDDVMFADNWPGKGDAIGRLLKMTHRGRSLMSTIALFH